MIASRGMHIRNTAYIPLNCKDIRITDINELSSIGFMESRKNIIGKTYQEVMIMKPLI